jgi:hypothetical protein
MRCIPWTYVARMANSMVYVTDIAANLRHLWEIFLICDVLCTKDIYRR